MEKQEHGASTSPRLVWLELLIGGFVLMMLASVLFPRMNVEIHKHSRRSQCINNQSNVALALIHYNQVHQRLPGWCVPQVSWEKAAAPRAASWVWEILPGLERADIYSEFGAGGAHENFEPGVYATATTTKPSDELHLKILICPVDTTALGQGANMSYVVNAGMSDRRSAAASRLADLHTFPDPDPTSTYREEFASGLFHNNYAVGAPSTLAEPTISRLVGVADGESNTLMVGENIDAGRWIDVQEPTVGMNWFPFEPTTENVQASDLRINQGSGSFEGRYPRASSFHPGGAVVAFADRHATFIDENIDHVVWSLLFTPRGGDLQFRPWDAVAGPPNVDPSFKEFGYTQVLREKF